MNPHAQDAHATIFTMQHISWLEDRGASLAAISEFSDGDCARKSADPAAKARLLALCGVSVAQLRAPLQVHGTCIVHVDSSSFDPETQADGLITSSSEISLGVGIADCVPVYLYHPALGIAALLHAGREGTLRNICAEAVRQICATWGEAAASGLFAYIGPSAGPCCYEVSEELAQQFTDVGLPRAGRKLDLWSANARQLISSGISSQNIACAQHCTICMGGFHSYRTHGGTARNIALLKL